MKVRTGDKVMVLQCPDSCTDCGKGGNGCFNGQIGTVRDINGFDGFIVNIHVVGLNDGDGCTGCGGFTEECLCKYSRRSKKCKACKNRLACVTA